MTEARHDEEAFDVRVLGPLEVRRGGDVVELGGPKPTLLFALLVSRAGQVVPVDALVDGLWGDDPPATARKALQVHVSNLRRSLGEDFPLQTAGGGYLIGQSGTTIDSHEFRTSLDEARAALNKNPLVAAHTAEAALAMWRGPAYAGMQENAALRGPIDRLHEQRLAAQSIAIDGRLRLGQHAEVVAELKALTAEHPFREDFRRLHMIALYRSGRQTEALRVFDHTRQILLDELGVDPSNELSELHRRILEQGPELDPATEEFEGGTLRSFLATHIGDSADLWQGDPDAMAAALAIHDRIASDAIEAAGGRLIRRTGDGFLATFDDPSDAIGAARSLQRELLDRAWPTEHPIRVGMAIDQGRCIEREAEFHGPVVGRVEQLGAVAHGGQIVVTDAVVSAASASTIDLGIIDLVRVGRVAIHQVVADELPIEFPPLGGDRAASTRPIAFGHAVGGYELRERLGEGAHAVVFRAYQPSIGREVALKVIRPEHANRRGFIKRFEAEAQYVAQLEHPHIVPLHDYWRDPSGAYLVMPWLRGGSLAATLERAPWDPPAAMRLLVQVGSALSYAHRQGVLHRDLKPANVLLDADGNAYLSDFGIASDHLMPVSDDEVVSSASYVSPEELANEPVGPPADIYAFALLANEVLTGTRPAPGAAPRSVVETRPSLPPALDAILARATDRDPSKRYIRVEDIIRSLRQAFGADVTTLDVASFDPDPGEHRNPYKGLRAFAETDASDFFGREHLVAELRERIATNRLTVVVGPSGTGKSSLVKAGLLPALRHQGLGSGRDVLITEMFPGAYPFEELETALVRVAPDDVGEVLPELLADDRGLLRVAKQIVPDDDSMLVIVVDQFEELFSLTHDDEVRRAFLARLMAVCADDRSPVRLVLTMRADFFDRPLEYAGFGELMSQHIVTVAMPGHDELARAIAEPARRAGLELDPGLVPLVIRDVVDEPGALPLMQHMLTELAEGRVGNRLTIDAYERAGGVAGSLAQRAEATYRGLSPEAQTVARDLFVLLVGVEADSADTRRRLRRSELDGRSFSTAALNAVIADFGSFRLLSFDRDPITRGQTIEVAHEALIREWPRLRSWVDARRETLLLQRRLETATVEWEANGRDDSFLFGGGQLAQYERLADSPDVRLTVAEREFLDASYERERADAERSRRHRRRVLGVVTALALIASSIAVVALVLRERAEESASAARAASEQAESLRSSAERSAATAAAAADEADELRAIADEQASNADALRLAAERNAQVESVRAAALAATNLAETDPMVATLVAIEAATAAEAAGVALPEVRTALWESTRRNHRIGSHAIDGPFWFVGRLAEVSPDGSRIVAVQSAFGSRPAEPNTTEILDAHDGRQLVEIIDDGWAEAAAWDNSQVVTANERGELTWWDADTGEMIRREQAAEEIIWHVALTDTHVAISRLLDTETGGSIVSIRERASGATVAEIPNALQAEFSADGRYVATFTLDSEIVIHDLISGAEVRRVAHDLNAYSGVASIEWFADRNALWIMRLNGTLVQLDVESGEVSDPRPEQLIGVDPYAISPSPGGKLLAVADGDSSVYVYDTSTYTEVAVLEGHQSQVWAVEWALGGARLYSMEQTGKVIVWDLTPRSASPLPFVGAPEFPVVHAQFDDDLVLLASRRGRGHLWNARTGESVERFGLSDEVQNLSTAADEAAGLIAAPADDGVRVYEVDERRWSFEFEDVAIDNPIAFSPDGQLLVASTSDTRSTLDPSIPVATVFFDHGRDRVVHRIEGLRVGAADFANDGSWAVMVGDHDGSPDGQGVYVVDTTTGRILGERQLDGAITQVVLAPDDRTFAVGMGGGDGRVRVIDVETLLQQPDENPIVASTFISTGQAVSGLAYSPDGSQIFTGDSEGVLRALDATSLEESWSIENGFVVTQLRVRDGLIHFAITSELSTGGGAGPFGVVAIPIDVRSFIDFASTTVTRDLTPDECLEYLGRPCDVDHGL